MQRVRALDPGWNSGHVTGYHPEPWASEPTVHVTDRGIAGVILGPDGAVLREVRPANHVEIGFRRR